MVTLFDQEKVMEIHDYHIVEAARRDGILEGHARGRAEGYAEGRIEGTLSRIVNLMETLRLSVETAMNALKVPEADRPRYRNLMGK